jgi:hypothetical protein
MIKWPATRRQHLREKPYKFRVLWPEVQNRIVSRPTQRRSADQRPVQELAELLPRHVPVPELANNRPLPLAL